MRLTREEAIAQVNGAFADMVGQTNAKTRLSARITAALVDGEPMPSVLLTGRSGIGKTFFAQAIGRAIGWEVKTVLSGGINTREAVEDIIYPQQERASVKSEEKWFSGLGAPIVMETMSTPPRAVNKVVFFDELHSLSRRATEAIYPILTERTLQMGVAGSTRVRPHFEFALIGASNVDSGLRDALENRFDERIQMEEYTPADLMQMARGYLSGTSFEFAPEAIMALLEPSQRLPRLLIGLLRSVGDILLFNGYNEMEPEVVTRDSVVSALRVLDYLPCGMHRTDMEYMRALHISNGVAGLRVLAAILSEDPMNVMVKREPWLMKRGFMQVTDRVRKLTGPGTEFYLANVHELHEA